MLTPQQAGMQPGGSAVSQKQNEFLEYIRSQALSQMTTKNPLLAEAVVGMKVIDGFDLSGDEATSGVAALFTNPIDDQVGAIIIPIIVNRGNVRPLDFLYIESADLFLPNTPSWSELIFSLRNYNGYMFGDSGAPPRSASSDSDIYYITRPPMRHKTASFCSRGVRLLLKAAELISDPATASRVRKIAEVIGGANPEPPPEFEEHSETSRGSRVVTRASDATTQEEYANIVKHGFHIREGGDADVVAGRFSYNTPDSPGLYEIIDNIGGRRFAIVIKKLGRHDCGLYTETPEDGEQPGAESSSGWYVLTARSSKTEVLGPDFVIRRYSPLYVNVKFDVSQAELRGVMERISVSLREALRDTTGPYIVISPDLSYWDMIMPIEDGHDSSNGSFIVDLGDGVCINLNLKGSHPIKASGRIFYPASSYVVKATEKRKTRSVIDDIRNPGFQINNTGNQTYLIDRRKFFSRGDAVNALVTGYNLSKRAVYHVMSAVDRADGGDALHFFIVTKTASVPGKSQSGQEAQPPDADPNQAMQAQAPPAVSGWGQTSPDQAAAALQNAGQADATIRNIGIADQNSPAPATDLAALSLLAQEDEDMSMIIQFAPAIIKGTDALLRVLFVLRTNEAHYSEKMGIKTYNSLVASIRSVLNKTGGIVSRLKRLGVMLSGLSQVVMSSD